MAQEAAIRITADGSAVVAAAKQAEGALQGIGAQADKAATSLKGTTQSSEGLSAAMRNLDKSAAGGGAGIQLLARGATMAATALLAAGAAAGAGFVGKLVEVQRQFDVLNSSMVTVTGSSANAAREMAWIKTFAKETPFGLEQAANAFVKMKALGLDPSQKALTSYGNTASAMGKDLSQMIEAVADASTGEFERLKEFGIKAKKNGDQVSLTFQGVTTSIGNNATEITQYLQAIGEKEFGGAMIERAKTLDGVISGLGDSWDELFRTIGASGVSQAITNELSGLDNYLTALTNNMNNAKEAGNGMVGTLSSGLGYIIARAPFDVLSSSANLLNGTLNLLTGGTLGLNTSVNLLPDAFKTSAQQAVALAQDLKRAEAEFAALKAQSDKQGSNIYIQSELAALAKYIAKMKEAQAQKAALTGASADPREANPAMTRGASYARWDQEQAEATKSLNAERMKAAGVSKDYIASIKVQQDALRLGLITEKEATTAIGKLVQKQYESSAAGKEVAKAARGGAAANQEAAKAAREADKAYNDLVKTAQTLANTKNAEADAITAWFQAEEAARISTVKAANDSVRAAQDEYDNYGKTKSQIAEVTLARLNDKLAGVNAGTEIAASIGREIDAKKRLIAVLQKGEVREVSVEAAKEAATEWKKTADDIERGLTDSLYRAFESGKGFFSTLWSGIKNLFKTTVLKMIINPVAGAVTGALSLSGTANAGSSTLSSLSSLSSLANIGSSIGTGITQTIANVLPGAVSSALGMTSSTLSSLSSLSSLANIGSSIGTGITQTIANVLPGAVSSALGMTSSTLMASNIALAGGGASATAAATAAAAAGNGAAMGGIGAGMTSALAAIPVWGWAALAAVAVASIFGGRGKKEGTGSGIEGNFSGMGFAGNNFSTWKQDGGWFHSDRTGKETNALDAATAKQFTDAYGAVKTSAAMAAVSLGLSADAITSYSQDISLQLGSDAAANEKAVAALFAGIGDNMALAAAPGIALLSKEGEATGATMLRLSSSLTAANAWLSMLRQRLFQVGLAGGDAASKLADTFGGLENMGAAVQAYYELYFTEAEKAATSTNQMTAALAAVGVAMPTTKEAFRAVAEGMDLNTESGRLAYATLLAIAPQFSQTSDAMAAMATDSAAAAAAAVAEASRLAQELSAKLLDTFSGRQQLIPLLNAALGSFDALSNGLDDAAGSTLDMGNATGWINTLLGQASSGLLYFGDQVVGLDQPLSGAQLAALSLTDQIINLKLNAGRTVTDIAGLSAALANVNTETFMITMDGVLKRLGDMFQGVLGDISSERIATREAALAIINPTVMSKDQIQRGISGANVGMPSNADLVAANNHLGYVDGLVATQKAKLASAQSQTVSTAALDAAKSVVVSSAALNAASSTLGAANARVNAAQAGVDQMRSYGNSNFNYFMDQAYAGNDLRGTVPNPSGERNAQNSVFELLAAQAAQQPAQSGYNSQLSAYNQAEAQKQQEINSQQTAYNQAKAAHEAVLAPIQNYLNTLTSTDLPWALQNAKNAQTAYIDSLQNYAIDASKATAKLGKLREETVKYYESQKALADLMAKSAGTLRQTVADYRYSQLSPEQQFRSLETQFNTAYSMALSTSGDTLAGYADQMSALMGPMLEKIAEAGYSTSLTGGDSAWIKTQLARAEAVAARVDALTPTNYAADSLAMLGQIDTTLAALEEGSKSAERIITDAINMGRDQTVNGLRQVVNALTGKGVAAFASGGMHAGGLRLVGENGPELEVTGPARIYSASQTRSMMGGGGAEVVAELRALRQDNANMRAELRAIASSSAKTARHLDRMDADGLLVRTDADTPLATVAA